MTRTHVPLIGTHNARCSCDYWYGPARRQDETQGQYTQRAYDAHQTHVERNTQLSLLADHQTLFDQGAR